MLDFLKRLFTNQDRELTFVIFDEDPESSTTHRFKPAQLWNIFYSTLAGSIAITLLLVMFTPIGGLMYNSEDAQLRQNVIEVSKKVQALQDSLQARDSQLFEMQRVIAEGEDTSFAIDAGFEGSPNNSIPENRELNYTSEVTSQGLLPQNEIIFSKIFKTVPEFPTDYPIEGTFTRGYNPEDGHYGIDIATEQGTSFKALADGAIVSQYWSINYGYVLLVQHSNGIITVYKHAASLSKSIGDIVLKGDILGTVGDVGVMSSGSHLHIEIWKDGVPQNPNLYLIKS